MAQSFTEFLGQGNISSGGASNLFNNQPSAPIQQQQKVPFSERSGLIQSVFQAPLNLGRFLGRYTSSAQQFKRSRLKLETMANQLKTSDLDPRRKQILANILDDVPTFDQVFEPKSAKQIIGDVIGTALFLAPASFGIKGATKAATLLRGAATGGAFGGAEAISDDANIGDVFKAIATGAVIGAPTQLGLSILGTAAGKATKGIFEKISEYNPRFFMSIRTRLERDYGDEGREVINRLLTADRNTLLRAGKEMDNLTQKGLFSLDDNSAKTVTAALEGRISPNDLPTNLKQVFTAIDELRNKTAQEARKVGLKVRVKRGEERPFFPRKNYFPHMTPSVERLEAGKIRDDVISNAVGIGKFSSHEEAAKALDSYLEIVAKNGKGGEYWVNWLVKDGQAETKDQARGMTIRFFQQSRIGRSGQLEKAREMDFPFYDPDPRRVIPVYVMGTIKRLEESVLFGQKFEKIDRLLGAIKRKQGEDASKEIRHIMKVVRGAVDSTPSKDRASAFLRTLQIPKLAFAQVANIGQNLNTFLQSDIKAFSRGLAYSFTEEGKRRALQTGSTLESILRESTRRAASETEFGERFLRMTGFSAAERANRIVSANTGVEYARSTFLKLQRNPTNKIFASRLNELGIDASNALKRGTLTEDELLIAGQMMSEITQFRGRAVDLPAFFSSPEGKIVTQFKSFAFHQAKFLKDRFATQIQNKNYSGIARDIFVLSTVFPMTGEVIADIRSLATGSKRPTYAFDRYISDFLSVGGFGIVSDTLVSANYGFLAENLLGPSIGTATDAVQRVVQGFNNRDIDKGDIKFLLNQTGFGRTISNYAFPNSKKDQSTFLETLNNVFDEY